MRAALVVVVALAVALPGCSSGTTPKAPRADSTAPVIAPGRPGEQARTLSPRKPPPPSPRPPPTPRT
ncbi:hypothetical protein ACFQQB_32755 [Nonomuraea rubra]|uniref:hypothetical protein n=1 Tax=Nonomuraea rubra TaxID=46180 RepID=UPI0036087FFE